MNITKKYLGLLLIGLFVCAAVPAQAGMDEDIKQTEELNSKISEVEKYIANIQAELVEVSDSKENNTKKVKKGDNAS